MWLLCDDALVSCPQRDTIQTVSSSALLHMLCRSLSCILERKKKKMRKHHQWSAIFASHEYTDVQARSLVLMPTSSQSVGLAVRGGQLD